MTTPPPLRRIRSVLVAAVTLTVLVMLVTLATLTTLETAQATPADAARRHARLLRSSPAKDTVLATSPRSIQLWFSEPIELSVSRVRLEDSRAVAVTVGTLTQDARVAGAPVTAAIPAKLRDGVYTVRWTAVAKDGHPEKGSFGFSVNSK